MKIEGMIRLKKMKRRLITLCLAAAFAICAAFPVHAADQYWLLMERSDTEVSTPFMHGNQVGDLYMEALSSNGDIYYAFTDQNDNLLLDGWLNQGSIIQFDSPSNRPWWFPYSFGPNVTDIKLTLVCNGQNNRGCEGSADLYVH